jgi:hypothetical protein
VKTVEEVVQEFALDADGWFFETDEDAIRHDRALEKLLTGRDIEVREDFFQKVMLVFREYLFDLELDIEGCSADDLTEIDHSSVAATELRRRIVAHVVEGADVRGQLKKAT